MTTAPATTQPITDSDDRGVERKLRSAFARQRALVHGRAAARLTTWVAALVLAAFAIDWLIVLPPAGRIALMVISGVLLLGVIWRHWLRHLRRFDPVRVALQVERAYPQLSSVLVSCVQFDRAADDPRTDVSPALLRAVRRQAQVEAGPLDFGRIVDFTQLHKRLIIAALALLLLLGVIVLAMPSFQVFAHRMIDPHSDRRYPTRTRVDPASITGDVTIKQGESVTINAAAAGMVPQSGTLAVRTDGGDWQNVTINRGDDDGFQHQFAGVRQSFDYQLKIGDYRSPAYRVTVVPPPRIVSVTVDQQFPGYTRRGRETSDSLNIQAPQGTELTWRIEFDRPLESARMLNVPREVLPAGAAGEPDSTDPTPAPLTNVELTSDGRVATARLTADDSFTYRLTFTDAQHGYAYDPQVRYSVHVTPDAPPDAELLQPRQMQQIGTLNKKVDLTYRLSDDYGVASAAIVYAVNDHAEQTLELGVFDNERIVERTYRWDVRQTIPELREGDVVTYAVRATDTQGGEPNVGRSAPRTLTVVSVAEYQRMIFEQIAELGGELQTVHEMEAEGSKAVEQLRRELETEDDR